MKSTQSVTFFLSLVFLVSCTTPPPVVEPDAVEMIRRDAMRAEPIVSAIDKDFKTINQQEALSYLEALAVRLAASEKALSGKNLSVKIIVPRKNKSFEYRSFGVPGTQILVSLRSVQKLGFENELAALLALELAHVSGRLAFRRWDQSSAELLPKPEGLWIFDFTEDELMQSVARAVRLVYQAGLDPRGLVALFQIYENLDDHSPYSRPTLARLIEKSRQEIAAFPPLRNPVVRSPSFIRMKERLGSL